ncbi:FixJ family two-component response regulator [Bradyrhizobium sp. JR7.2]|uniref:response regulator transcription factor n=1 Tax=unclassified Bradyrhizobium TaxID=2631580 RepID=UPI00339AF6C5
MAQAGPLIAIVDDDPAVLKGLSRLLRSHGFRVRTYESGQEFLATLPGGLPECLIVDLQMRGMNGLELQQNLVSSGTSIPTILISAYDDIALRGHSGLVASLRKPLEQRDLFEAIERAIGHSRSTG